MPSATWCELEGLKRVVNRMDEEGLVIDTLITDRHRQIGKFVREECPEIRHLFDVWHIAKGTEQ